MTRDSEAGSGIARQLAAVTVGLLFSLALVYAVVNYVAEPFRYMGYVPRGWDLSEVVVALLANVALAMVPGARINTAGRGALAFLVVFVGAPVIWLPVFYGVLPQGSLTMMNVAVVASFAVSRITLEMFPRINFPRLPKKIPAVTGLVVISLAGLSYIVLTTGISINWVNLLDAYEQRDEYSAATSPAVAYAIGWVGSGILPILAAVGVWRRSPVLVAVGFGGLLSVYMLTGFKSYILGAALVAALCVLVGKRERVSAARVYAAFTAMVVLAMVMDEISQSLIFTSIGVRRALATAGINSAYFFDFFSSNDSYGLRHSVLDFLGDPPYAISPARLIGLTYYGSDQVAANANYLADGLANFGILGMLGAAVVIGIWLSLVDSASQNLPVGIAFPALILVLVALSNTAGLTVMATHGGFMAVASLWILSESSMGLEARKEGENLWNELPKKPSPDVVR